MKTISILFCILFILISSTGISLANNKDCETYHIRSNNHDFTSQDSSCDKFYIEIKSDAVSEISKTIKYLKNIKQIGIHDNCYVESLSPITRLKAKECIRKNVNLPMELFSLPNLETLGLVGGINYSVHAADHTDTIHSSIKKIDISRADQSDFPFLSKLDSAIEVNIDTEPYIDSYTLGKIPEYIYDMKNIKKLSVEVNKVPLKLSSRICEMPNLEELNFDGTAVDIPLCKNGMDKVKTVAIRYCGEKGKINGEKYYFPSGILQFKNIENLRIVACGRFEMPPYAIGMKKLKYFSLIGCDQGQYVQNQASCPNYPISGRSMGGINILNLSGYTDIESIYIEKPDIFDNAKGHPLPASIYDLETSKFEKIWNAGQKKFIQSIAAAFKNGKLPHLKEVLIPDLKDPEPMLVFPSKNKQSE